MGFGKSKAMSISRNIITGAGLFVFATFARADNCSASIDLVGFSDDTVTFQITVSNCHNSSGSYDYTVQYKDAKGTKRTKHWSRPFEHVGASSFEVTDHPGKSSDEVVRDISDEHISRCVCNDSNK